MNSCTQLLQSLPPRESERLLENEFPYLHSKASLFLKLGATKYRKQDALGVPHKGISRNELSEIKDVCKMIQEGIGFTEEKPLFDISMSAFYSTMTMFHFEEIHRSSVPTFRHGAERGLLDMVTFEQVMTRAKTTLCIFYPFPAEVLAELQKMEGSLDEFSPDASRPEPLCDLNEPSWTRLE